MNWIKNKSRAQITISALYGVILLIGSVATPIVWLESRMSVVKEVNAETITRVAVLENSIKNTDKNVEEIKKDIGKLKDYFNIK